MERLVGSGGHGGMGARQLPVLFWLLALSGCAQWQWQWREVAWPWLTLTEDDTLTLTMEPTDGSRDVDPRGGIRLVASGSGARLTRVDVRDEHGRAVDGVLDGREFAVQPPLSFDTRYRVVAIVGNDSGEAVRHELEFRTLSVPKLQGGTSYTVTADGSVTLTFDRPVGEVSLRGGFAAKIERDASQRVITVRLDHYAKGAALPAELSWASTGGVPFPPLSLQFNAAPPLKAELSVQGQTNLGLGLPVELRFDEAVADREHVPGLLSVLATDKTPVEGRWQWLGDQRLRFTPKPHWPATSTIEFRAEPGAIRSTKGGANSEALLGSFGTGADRRIIVYLDSQRLAALENGQVIKNIKVSTGKAATPTVTGSFYIYARYPRKTMRSQAKPGEPGHYVVENVPYAQYFHADYALHGAWWHNGFGRPASHGCVNIPTRTNNRRWPKSPEEAGWLYEWATLGTPVTVQRSAAR